jgi:acylphosphatase
MPEKVRVHIFVSGKVQGVFFRSNTQKKAKDLNISGWVRNLPNGRVEMILEGKREKIQELIEWTKKGPSFSKVDNVEIEWQEYIGEFKNFDIRY